MFFFKPVSLILESWSWWWDGLADHTTIRAVVIFLAATVAILWYARLINKTSKVEPPLPPGPPGLPLLGNLLSLEPDLHLYFAKLSQTYGPIVKVQMGCKTCIVINSSSLAKQVLKDYDAVFANRDPLAAGLAITYGGLDMVWSPNGPEWRKLRKVCVRELMSNTNLDACYSLRRQEVRKMVNELYRKTGSPIDIGELSFLTALNVITSILWGASVDGNDKRKLGYEFRHVMEEMVRLLGKPNISDIFPVLAPFDLQGIKLKMKKLLLWFDGTFDPILAGNIKADETKGAGKKNSNKRKDFLQVLLELKQQEDDKTSLSATQIKALLIDIFSGATDSTSTTVEWAMAELLQHPEILKTTCEELERVVGDDNTVEEPHIPNLHYLSAVIKETWRMHPPLPLLVPHSPSETSTLAGYTIPKGSRVVLNTWFLQRDPEAWENPLVFKPERFLEDAGTGDYHGNNFNFLPFGSGRRICAGIPLAERMVTYMLATLLHSFEWKLPVGQKLDMSEKFGFVMKKSDPLVVVPTARLPTEGQYC